MHDSDIEEAVRELTDRYSRESIGSIDYSTNARAIALGSSQVSDRLAEVLRLGNKLKSVEPVPGFVRTPLDFRLRFHFESDSIIGLSDVDFIAIVELTSRCVKRLIVPDEENYPTTLNTPFSLAVPSRATEHKVPLAELKSRLSRTHAYFERNLPGDIDERLRQEGFARRPRNLYTDVDSWSDTDVLTTIDSLEGTATASNDHTMDHAGFDECIDREADVTIDQQLDVV